MTVPAVALEIALVSSAVVSTTTVAACAWVGRTASPAPNARAVPRVRAVRRDIGVRSFRRSVRSAADGWISGTPVTEVGRRGVQPGLGGGELRPVLRDGDHGARS